MLIKHPNLRIAACIVMDDITSIQNSVVKGNVGSEGNVEFAGVSTSNRNLQRVWRRAATENCYGGADCHDDLADGNVLISARRDWL
ncbi:hypothetical protein WM40_14460 [Robbsia andropogonis]|uniref:Uncharacterized protein n=1 Tax=Robbsia andropogonis TaxID=28092 RepID=A0A0F5JYI2_9BURK|nr:hypothetical protein WM40_14460 [Robbsia andropogonis]